MHQVTYRAIAVAEYEEAIKWYHERNPTAAEKFVHAVNTKLDKISSNPWQYKSLFKNFREVSISRYPYSIVYFIDEEHVRVVLVAVYHHKRDPKKKYRR